MDCKSQINMSAKKTMKKEKEKVRCVFCNSLSHKKENCNSTLNGRRNHLDQGWDFQIHDECPNFEVLAVHELRYVAWHYAAYEGAIHNWDKKTSQQYNRKFKFRPIDLTLSKTQLVKELVRRWEIFQPVRELIKNKPEPTKEDECPICLECDTTTYDWSPNISNWVKKNENIITECKHSFCKRCWKSWLEKSNNQYHYWDNGEYKVDILVSCPLCIRKLKYQTTVK